MVKVDDLRECTLAVCEIAKRAGEYIRQERTKFKLESVERKHAHDYVSYVDKGSEQLIVTALRQLLPQAGFITEEGLAGHDAEQMLWVVDPLDGTTNFIHQYAPYAVSIALLQGKEILIGVVYEITADECYYAWQGGGAYMDGTQLHVSGQQIQDALLCLQLPYNSDAYKPTIKRLIDHLYGNVGSIRMCGSAAMARASFLPLKVNSAGVMPIIFSSSIMMAPSVIASFISSEAANASWLGVFNYSQMFEMPWFNGGKWYMPWGLIIYTTLNLLFAFFYAQMEIDPATLADNFQKNGSYIPGIRPGKETERYVGKVLNRVTCIGAFALAFIAALPVIFTLAGAFGNQTNLAIGGTGMIIIVGVALEMNAQIDGLLAGKSFEQVQAGGGIN